MKLQNSFSRRLAAGAFLILALPAMADQTWKGTTDNLWTTTGNWSGNAIPTAGDLVIFNNLSTGNLSSTLGADFTIGGLNLTNPPSAVSINGANKLTINNNGINMTNATASLTISSALGLGANQSWIVGTNQTLTINGVLSGSSGLFKDGVGALYLNGANTFTGNITNNSGPIWINNSSALGVGPKSVRVTQNAAPGLASYHLNGAGGNLTFDPSISWITSQQFGAIFNEAGDNTINGNLTVTTGGGSTYIVVNAGSLLLGGNVSLDTAATSRPLQLGGPGNGYVYGNINDNGIGHLSLTKSDAGTWAIYGANTLSGTVTVQGGTLALAGTATMLKTTNILVSAGATLDVSQVAPLTVSSGTVTQTLGGSGSVNGNVAFNNAGFLAPGGANAFGTLTLSNNLSLNSSSTVLFDLNTNATVGGGTNDLLIVQGNMDAANATIKIVPAGVLASPATYTLINYGSESSSFNPTVAGGNTRYAFTLQDTGAGQVNLGVTGGPIGLTWYGGNNSGTWDTLTTLNWNAAAQKFYQFDSVTFDDTAATGAVTISGAQQPTAVTFNNSALNYTVSGTGKITGSTGLTKSGSGTLTVSSGTHDYTGPVTINGGTLNVATVALNGSASTLGAGTNITLNGGTFQFGGARPNASTFNRLWTLGSNGGTVLSTNGVFFIPGVISGSGSFTKSGTVQIILGDIVGGVLTNANNTYAGNTYINQGELQIRNAHAVGAGKVVVANGADLAFGGGASYGAMTNEIDLNGDGGSSLAGALQVNDANTIITFSGTINLVTNASVGVFANASGFTISGPIVGPGLLRKASHAASTIILTCPTNSYSGGTLVTGGTLQLGNGSTCGGLGTGPVTNSGVLIFNHNDTATLGVGISGAGTLTNTGAGTLVLTGSNTYTGATAVSGGTLLVDGSLGATPVTVATNATLGGYGSIGGAVAVNKGGTLALGAAIGTLTINSSLALNGTNIMKVSHAANDQVTGMSSVQFGGELNIVVNGTLQGGETFQLFNASSYSNSFTATNLPALASGLSWDASALSSGTLRVTGGAPPPAPKFTTAPFQLNDGTFQIKFSGTSGNYRLWATTNAALRPVTNTWSNVASGTFNGSTVTFKDGSSTNYPHRFYTITQP